MNLNFFSVCLLLILFSYSGVSQDKLEVRIKNVKQQSGHIMLAIFDSEDTFLGEAYFHAERKKVDQKGMVSFSIENLPYGRYAISVFHDKNDNEDLDTNFAGLPTEPYGFSNNARGFFGPPDFRAAAFEHQAGGEEIVIKLR